MRIWGCAGGRILIIRLGERLAQSGLIETVLLAEIVNIEPLFGADRQLHNVP